MKILMIQRAEVFSPNSVERDWAILHAVADGLRQRGCEVESVCEDDLTPDTRLHDYGCIATMGRRPATLDRLLGLGGCRIVNRPEGVAACARSRLAALMGRIGTPVPPANGPDGYWLKRGDAAAQTPDDVVYAPDKAALGEAIRTMEARGITDYTVSAHVQGDLVKFYGVLGTGFFHYCYPTDDGQLKFGHERLNGPARHYAFDLGQLRQEAERLAVAVGVAVYGGDCIVRPDGSFCLIDFNDWPSFSRCRTEAAAAIIKIIDYER